MNIGEERMEEAKHAIFIIRNNWRVYIRNINERSIIW